MEIIKDESPKGDPKENEKLDLYWQKLCAEHDVDNDLLRMFDELKGEDK